MKSAPSRRQSMIVTSLKPNVSREQAAQMLKGPIRQARRGRLHIVMDFYIPCRLFRIEVINANKTAYSFLAIDSVTGGLDPYFFAEPPPDAQRVVVESCNVARVALNEAQAFESLKERVKRGVYLKGFFRVSDLEVKGVCVESLHLPYWVGIYRNNDRANLEALDAVRRRFEGPKVREIVAAWFHSTPEAKDQ